MFFQFLIEKTKFRSLMFEKRIRLTSRSLSWESSILWTTSFSNWNQMNKNKSKKKKTRRFLPRVKENKICTPSSRWVDRFLKRKTNGCRWGEENRDVYRVVSLFSTFRPKLKRKKNVFDRIQNGILFFETNLDESARVYSMNLHRLRRDHCVLEIIIRTSINFVQTA